MDQSSTNSESENKHTPDSATRAVGGMVSMSERQLLKKIDDLENRLAMKSDMHVSWAPEVVVTNTTAGVSLADRADHWASHLKKIASTAVPADLNVYISRFSDDYTIYIDEVSSTFTCGFNDIQPDGTVVYAKVTAPLDNIESFWTRDGMHTDRELAPPKFEPAA
ncbi:MAG: hypothetical protein ACJAYC_002744 [Halieaceae bacterium]|jgi:hypothetical protein